MGAKSMFLRIGEIRVERREYRNSLVHSAEDRSSRRSQHDRVHHLKRNPLELAGFQMPSNQCRLCRLPVFR